jgi:hypothetical protein
MAGAALSSLPKKMSLPPRERSVMGVIPQEEKLLSWQSPLQQT